MTQRMLQNERRAHCLLQRTPGAWPEGTLGVPGSGIGRAILRSLVRAQAIFLSICCLNSFAQSSQPPVLHDADARAESQARAIVQRADENRFPKDGFQVDVTVNSVLSGESQEPRKYRISSKGSENAIVQTLEPPSERGQSILMKGRDLWIFMPSVSQPIRLSLAQRLTGQVANGDLARANFSGDYDARILRTEAVDGKDHYVLELVAVDRNVTYPKIHYWVRVGDGLPHKAEFFALSGRLLKTCRYENYQPLGGRTRPTRLVMTDAIRTGDESVLEYSGLKIRDLPDRMFSKEYLRKLD